METWNGRLFAMDGTAYLSSVYTMAIIALS
jgi:hypothetical protein